MLNASKGILRWKFIALNIYITILEECQVNNQTFYMKKKIENEEQNKPKAKRKYIRAAINYI